MVRNDVLTALQSKLEAMLAGRNSEPLADHPLAAPELRPVLEKVDLLAKRLLELNAFTSEVANGNLEIDAPGRHNLLAAPMKEIHSQLSSLQWSMKQLIDGNIVSKLYYSGELYASYNALIEKVSKLLSSSQSDSTPQWGTAVSSWRYHQLLSAINHLHIIVIEVDQEGTILFANPPARELLSDAKRLPDIETQHVQNELLHYLSTFSSCKAVINPLKHREFSVLHELYEPGSGAWYKITSDQIELADGSFGFLHMIDDISEWKHHEEQLNLRASIDPLTSAYTRRAGFSKLDEMLKLDKRQQAGSIAFIDMDGMKQINDTYGHPEGDYAIKTVAEVLISSIRETDWVIRYGGDEFLILFYHCPEAMAREAIERMYTRLAEVNASNGKEFTLAFSYGLMAISDEYSHAEDLITAVDAMMYANKQAKKAHRGANSADS